MKMRKEYLLITNEVISLQVLEDMRQALLEWYESQGSKEDGV